MVRDGFASYNSGSFRLCFTQPRPQGFSLKKWKREKPWERGCALPWVPETFQARFPRPTPKIPAAREKNQLWYPGSGS